MSLCVIVHGRPGVSANAATALAFCQAAQAAGRSIEAVLFRESASLVLAGPTPAEAGRPSADQCWLDWSRCHAVPLLVCSSAAARRGLSCAARAVEPGYYVPAGLALMLAAVERSARTVVFPE